MQPVVGAPLLAPVDICILTVIPPELDAARDALGPLQRVKEDLHDTITWHGAVRSELRGCDYTVVLAGIGAAGNASASALASQLIERYRPTVFLLMGIAAGMRGKVRIGEVVLSERVVAYELAALAVGADGERRVEPRPEISRVSHGLQQDVLNYRLEAKRLTERFTCLQGEFPAAPRGQKKVWQEHVASSVSWRSQVTLASGDKLLRDPGKLRELRRDLHGKVEVGEMEAAGLVEACRLRNVPWLVIRGISDFGDELKNDAFHGLASKAAAAVMADFLSHGLDLGEKRAKAAPRGGTGKRKSPFVVGLPILLEQDFFGRKHEQTRLLDAIGKGLPVQLLGGAKVGKSSLLRWVERHVPAGRPVAWIEPGGALSPVTLVAEIARKLGRDEVVTQLKREGVSTHAAEEQLQSLGEFVLVMDEADKLATAGREFEEGFFEKVRGLVERRALTWVSASRRDLYDLFLQRGLTSRFLNSSERLWLGPLDPDAAREVAAQGAAEHVDRMLREAGGFAYGLQWLGDRLLRMTDVEEVCDTFREEMDRRVFSSWWEGLQPVERALLKDCGRSEVHASGEDESRRRRLRSLHERGFLVKNDGRYGLALGEAWKGFVHHAGG
jgi:nucleoside phosphorylase